VKRTVIAAAGAVALGVALHASTLLAQTGTTGTAAAQPRSRIALLNLSHVIKKYNKFTTYQNELKTAVEPFQARDTDLKKRGEALAKEGQAANTTAEKRDQIEKQLKELQRQIEDNKNDAQKVLIKKQEEQLKTLYMDVYNVVQRVAQAHSYDMVLHYNDAVERDDYWSPSNIARKMNAGALVPMYYAPGIDISEYVVTTLNRSTGSAAAAPAAAATGGTR